MKTYTIRRCDAKGCQETWQELNPYLDDEFRFRLTVFTGNLKWTVRACSKECLAALTDEAVKNIGVIEDEEKRKLTNSADQFGKEGNE